MSCVACRILLGSFRPQVLTRRPDVDAVCARRRASVSKTPVRLDFDRLLGSCVLKKTGMKRTDGAGRPRGARCGRGSVRKQKSRRPGRWDQRLDSACFKAPFNFRHAPGFQAWRVAEPVPVAGKTAKHRTLRKEKWREGQALIANQYIVPQSACTASTICST